MQNIGRLFILSASKTDGSQRGSADSDKRIESNQAIHHRKSDRKPGDRQCPDTVSDEYTVNQIIQ